MIDISQDIDCWPIFLFRLIRKSVRDALEIILQNRAFFFSTPNSTQTYSTPSQIRPTFPWRLFRTVSRFLTVASATGTVNTEPVGFPVLWSTNWIRTLPRSAGMVGMSACFWVFSIISRFWRLLGGGNWVAIVSSLAQFELFESGYVVARLKIIF